MRTAIIAIAIVVLATAALATEKYAITPIPLGEMVTEWNLDGCNITFPAGDETDAAQLSCVYRAITITQDGLKFREGPDAVKIQRLDGAEAVEIINNMGTVRKMLYQKAIAAKLLPGKGTITGSAALPTPKPKPTEAAEKPVEPVVK